MRNVRIGAVNWDCSLPPDTYFGYYQTNSLSPRKYRTITPFYADILGGDRISYHYRTQEEYDRELSYAIDAGIDYFAYVWYGEEASRNPTQPGPSCCSHKVYELTYARKMHCSSALRDKLHMCAIASAHPFSERDLRELVLTMQEAFYEKIDGRPLLYVFNGCREEVIRPVRELCGKLGFSQPFIVPLYSCSVDSDGDYSGADALSAYTCEKLGIECYAQLSEAVLADNESRRQTGLPVIPLYSVGWDPSPRVDHPCPWYGYPDEPYMRFASEEELMDGAKDLACWIRDIAADSFAGHILTFAWNEFEEGGMICPMLTAAGEIDTSRAKVFGKISAYFKEVLKTI